MHHHYCIRTLHEWHSDILPALVLYDDHVRRLYPELRERVCQCGLVTNVEDGGYQAQAAAWKQRARRDRRAWRYVLVEMAAAERWGTASKA